MVRSFVIAVLSIGILGGCMSTPRPSGAEVANACLMLTENRNWYKALRASAKDWGAPMGYQLAVLKQESSFDQHARPARGDRKLLGLLPGERPSSAYGYSQALDGTWERYKNETGNGGADRNNFGDSVDFVGWYFATTGAQVGVGQFDYYAHYLAYHEGHGGYMRDSYRKKPWLMDVAKKVATSAKTYEGQIRSCNGLQSKKLFGFL